MDDWLKKKLYSQDSESTNRNSTTIWGAYSTTSAFLTWLDLAHQKLDGAVFDAYGWPHALSDEEILARLLALNLERAGVEGRSIETPR